MSSITTVEVRLQGAAFLPLAVEGQILNLVAEVVTCRSQEHVYMVDAIVYRVRGD